jgi:hypothetical protein
MTLICEMTTPAALNIAADRRLIDRTGAIEEIPKIIPWGQFTAVAIHGAPRAKHPVSHQVQFDAFAEVQEFAGVTEYSEAAINALGNRLVTAYEAYLKNETEKGGAGSIKKSCFHVQVYSRNGGIARRFHLPFIIPAVYKCAFVIHQYPLNDSRLNAHASLEVINELLYGYDKRFDDIRARADVQKVRESIELQRPIPFGSFTNAEALEFCAWLIRISSERFPLLSKGLNPIGPQPDVVVIDADGFRFVK